MKTLGGALSWWVEVCERSPRTILGVVAVLCAGAAAYVAVDFSIDSDLNKLIRPSESLAWYRANEQFKDQFPELQETSIVVVSGVHARSVEAVARRLADTFRASNRFEFVFAPALDPFLQDHRAYFLDPGQLEDWIRGVQYDYGALLRLADGADLANAAFTMADQVAATQGLRLPTVLRSLADSFSLGVPERLSLEAYPHLVPQEDVHYLIIMLKGLPELHARLPYAAQVDAIRSMITETPGQPNVRVRLTGEVPLATEEIGMALDGIGIAGSISLVLLALILYFGIGSWRIIVATFLLLGAGVLFTLAFAIAAIGAFNTLALIFVVMFFGLGVDFAVHFALRMREGMAPDSTEDPEVHVAREIGPALALCMTTSSIAFLSFAPTPYRGLGELGVVSAGGMLIAFLLTLTLLPAFFSLSGLPSPSRQSLRAFRLPLKPGVILSAALLVALAAGWFAREVRFDYSVLALRDAGTEAMSTLLELQENGVTTDYSISVLAPDEARARSLKLQISALPEVGEVMIPADLVPAGQDGKQRQLRVLEDLLRNIGPVEPADPSFAQEGLREAVAGLVEVRDRVPEGDRKRFEQLVDGLSALAENPDRLAAVNQQFHEALVREIRELRDIVQARPFAFDELPEDLRSRLISRDGWHLMTILPAGAVDSREDMDAFVAAVTSIEPEVGGRTVVEWGVGEVAVRSFVEALSLAVVAISVLLVVYFRGIVLPLVVLLPLSLTTLITFAVIQLTPLTLNMANILVIPLIFGLGVDSGIHVVHRHTAVGEVGALFASSTARAIIISALTTIGTFFSLSFSPHKGAASVGMLLTIAISVMLIVTMTVVPALLEVLTGRKRSTGGA